LDTELGEELSAKLGEFVVGAISRAWTGDPDLVPDATVGEDEHAVGKQQCLVDVVGHQQYGGLVCGP
jgi:hypothetical protein